MGKFSVVDSGDEIYGGDHSFTETRQVKTQLESILHGATKHTKLSVGVQIFFDETVSDRIDRTLCFLLQKQSLPPCQTRRTCGQHLTSVYHAAVCFQNES